MPSNWRDNYSPLQIEIGMSQSVKNSATKATVSLSEYVGNLKARGFDDEQIVQQVSASAMGQGGILSQFKSMVRDDIRGAEGVTVASRYGTAQITDEDGVEHDDRLGFWITTGVKVCPGCQLLHGAEMTFAEFMEIYQTNECGVRCYCFFQVSKSAPKAALKIGELEAEHPEWFKMKEPEELKSFTNPAISWDHRAIVAADPANYMPFGERAYMAEQFAEMNIATHGLHHTDRITALNVYDGLVYAKQSGLDMPETVEFYENPKQSGQKAIAWVTAYAEPGGVGKDYKVVNNMGINTNRHRETVAFGDELYKQGQFAQKGTHATVYHECAHVTANNFISKKTSIHAFYEVEETMYSKLDGKKEATATIVSNYATKNGHEFVAEYISGRFDKNNPHIYPDYVHTQFEDEKLKLDGISERIIERMDADYKTDWNTNLQKTFEREVKIKTTLGAEYIERQKINYSMEYAKFKGKE